MTDRLYYIDPSRRSFDARVIRALEHAGHPAVVLDTTAFYPTSGGQPFDTGRLGDAAVIDVADVDGDVVHVLSAPLAAGDALHVEIDWARRFDHMQQHTGQHLLSAAFDHLFDNRTVSFHMGTDVSTIDLAREMPPDDVERGVDQANRVVWDDRPVAIRFVSADEVRALPLRKETLREGTVRLIEVPDFDLSACGGTHVTRTGAIGAIAVTAIERFRGGARLTFVCGGRVVAALRSYRDAVAGSVRALSVLPSELPAAVERMQADAKELRKTVGRVQETLAGHEAARLLADAEIVGSTRVVVRVVDGWDAAGAKAMASGVVAAGGAAAALVSSSTPAFVVVARSSDVGAVDASRVLRNLLETFGGRGGGKPDLAQGGGLHAPAEAILSAARDAIGAAIRGSSG